MNAPVRLTREQQRARNREALLDAAAAVFGTRGFRVATIDEVAEAAGLTKGAVYSHFSDKHDLFASTIERRYEHRLAAFRSLLDQGETPEAGAATAALDFAASVTDDADWALLFLEAWAEMLREASFGERLRRISDEITATLAQLLETQLAELAPASDLTAEELAKSVLAMSHGFGVEHRLDPDRVPAELFGRAMAVFTSGLITGGGAAGPPAHR